MARDWARLDEDDVRVRPGRGSRPRTRRRPAHEDAVGGFVMAVDRGRYTCLVDGRPVTAMRARELGRKSVVVGDRVRLVGDVSGRPDTLARVVGIEPRTSTLRRTADDSDPVERVIVANADNLVIVTALADPPPRPRMIDRCLVAAFDAGLSPLLCLTKADLAAPDALEEMYAPLGVTYVVTRKDRPVDELRSHLAGRMSVLVGHSGVGKSTLVNALVPDAERAVSAVNPVTGRGLRHVVVGDRPRPAGRRRLDHRHAGRAQLRPRPRQAGRRAGGVPGPDRGRRGVPAALHPRPGRLRPGRLGGGGPRRPLTPGLAAAAPAEPRRRRGLRGWSGTVTRRRR